MRRLRRCVLFFAALPLLAHHSTAEFDMTKEFTVSGVVTDFAWLNPHSAIRLDSTEPDGMVHHWLLEAESVNLLQRNGWAKNTLKKGDEISCLGARAKDPEKYSMKCFVVTFPDGRKLKATPVSVPRE